MATQQQRVRTKPTLEKKPAPKAVIKQTTDNPLARALVAWSAKHDEVLAAQRDERSIVKDIQENMDKGGLSEFTAPMANGLVVTAVNKEMEVVREEVNLVQLKKMVSDELFMRIISATKKAVTEFAGTSVLQRCVKQTKSVEKVFKLSTDKKGA